MANIRYLLQGKSEKDDHLAAINHIFQLANIQQVFISVAFVREAGIELIESILLPHFDKTELFLGIRNGITSVQAVLRLIKNKCYPVAIDTSSSYITFHPKIFVTMSKEEARIIIGSANCTVGGFVNNIEASALIETKRDDTEDEQFLNDILGSMPALQNDFPENIFKINSTKEAYVLYKEGRLVDERTSKPNTAGAKTKKSTGDIAAIKTPRRRLDAKPIKKLKESKIRFIKQQKAVAPEWLLLWKSNPLTERDLNIPSGTRTHATGSMLFKKGVMLDIDHRHYFRESIFNELNWTRDDNPRNAHLERATTRFEIIINGITFGVFDLRLTHNSRTDTRSYEQKNSMTQIHWGEARSIIADEAFLGSILTLYRPLIENDKFIIEINQ